MDVEELFILTTLNMRLAFFYWLVHNFSEEDNGCILSFGWLPSIWILCADISEHSVCSMFIGGA